MPDEEKLGPILILGLAQRTGTNYLSRLLASHPECTSSATLHEDFIVHGLQHLENYIYSVSQNWNKKWQAHARIEMLYLKMGRALAEFLQEDAKCDEKRPVFKSPSIKGIELVNRFLPDVDVIVLLRQGPAVVESGMKSFGWEFDSACRSWARASETVVAVSEQRKKDGLPPLNIVRYEDLVTDTAAALRRIFGLVKLDPARFDFDRLGDFPVYGSSQLKQTGQDLHWEMVTKGADFNPLARAANWTPAAFKRFDRLTGGISEELGYDLPYRCQPTLLSEARLQLQNTKRYLPWRLQRLLRYKP